MWPRDFEIALGLWLVMSPFVFRVPFDEPAVWVLDVGCGALVMTLATLSYWRRTRRIHLLELVPALGLLAHGWITNWTVEGELATAANHVLAGLLVAMFAIIPPDASQPPRGWREDVGEGRT